MDEALVLDSLRLCRHVVHHLDRPQLARLLAHRVTKPRACGYVPGEFVDMVSHILGRHHHEFCRSCGTHTSDLGATATEEDACCTDHSVWAWILVSTPSSRLLVLSSLQTRLIAGLSLWCIVPAP